MRPIKLTMTAFGPFLKKTVIDFSLFGNKGLYLISGETGSGKTTIFDAIAFTLFGKTSGGTRDAKMIRSLNAPPTVQTEVELVFEYNGREYQVRRNPGYDRPKKRSDDGKSTTSELAKVELICPDGQIFTKTKEVDKKIQEILQVTYEQFSQIVMIAQGDFLKLLYAKTEDRVEILRKVFNTQFYDTLEKRLVEDYRSWESHRADLLRNLKRSVDDIVCPDCSAFSQGFKEAKERAPELYDTDSLIAQLEGLLQEDSLARKNIDQKIIEIEEALIAVNGQITQAREIEKRKQTLKAKTELMSQEKPKLESLQKEFEAEEANDPLRADLEKQIQTLELTFPDYDARETDLSELLKTTQALEKEQTELKAARSASEKNKNDCEAAKAERAKLENAGELKLVYNGQLTGQQKRQSDLKTLQTDFDEWKRLENSLQKAQDDYQSAKEEYNNKKSNYDRMNKIWLDEQAGILAGELVEGMPCPVCGAREHPQPAQKTEAAPTRESLAMAKNEAEAAAERMEKASNDASQIKGKVKTKTEALQAKQIELLGLSNLDQLQVQIEQELAGIVECIAKLNQLIADEEQHLDRKAELDKTIPDLENAEKGLIEKISKCNENIVMYSTQIKSLEKQIEDRSRKLTFKSKDDAQSVHETQQKELKRMKALLEKVRKKLQDKRDEINGLEGEVRALTEQTKNDPVIDLDAKTAEADLLTADKKDLLSKKTEIDKRSSNTALLEKFKADSTEYAKICQKCALCKKLADTASGNIKGKQKVHLETYVQMAYFDRILVCANDRLETMSEGRYELKRRDVDGKDLKNNFGLELNVLDYYSGLERSVKSLSGGESFMASLSLAFGLSDQIQAAAGGVHLESLFVDEGFGSLDENSLRLALKVLNNMAEGKRLIGVISHVAELNESIDRKIVVKKMNSDGSTIEVTS